MQAKIKSASKAVRSAPLGGVPKLLGILSAAPGNARARAMLKGLSAAERRKVTAGLEPPFRSGDRAAALRVPVPLGRIFPADAPPAGAEARCRMQPGPHGKMATRVARPPAAHPDNAALLAALDLPPDPATIGFTGAKGDVRSASSAQVRGPVRRQATADWHRDRGHLEPLIGVLGDLPARHHGAVARALATDGVAPT